MWTGFTRYIDVNLFGERHMYHAAVGPLAFSEATCWQVCPTAVACCGSPVVSRWRAAPCLWVYSTPVATGVDVIASFEPPSRVVL